MNTRRPPSLTGLADLTTRRTSLLTVGGAALATLAGHAPEAAARKTKSKARKARKRCEKQGTACQDFAARLCALHHAPGPLRQSCENRANACCASIEQCDGGAYFVCLFDHLEALEPV